MWFLINMLWFVCSLVSNFVNFGMILRSVWLIRVLCGVVSNVIVDWFVMVIFRLLFRLMMLVLMLVSIVFVKCLWVFICLFVLINFFVCDCNLLVIVLNVWLSWFILFVFWLICMWVFKFLWFIFLVVWIKWLIGDVKLFVCCNFVCIVVSKMIRVMIK